MATRARSSRPPLFRSQALEHAARNRQQAILPRVAKPPVFLLLWILLILVMLSLLLLWISRVPVYLSASGIVIEPLTTHQRETVALLFVPDTAARPIHLRAGMPVLVQIGAQAQQFTTTIESIDPALLSPEEIEQQYTIGRTTEPIKDPSLVISVMLGSTVAPPAYVGSPVKAQIQVGSISVLSLMLGSTQPEGV